jgi:hypothetical protein
MNRQKGGVILFLLIVLVLAIGLFGFRYYQVTTSTDIKIISQIKLELESKLKSGGLKGMIDSLNQGDIGGAANQALSMINQEIVIIDIRAARPLLDFSDNPETIYRVAFNVEQNNKILASDIRYMTYQDSLSDGLRFRGESTREAFYRKYLGL